MWVGFATSGKEQDSSSSPCLLLYLFPCLPVYLFPYHQTSCTINHRDKDSEKKQPSPRCMDKRMDHLTDIDTLLARTAGGSPTALREMLEEVVEAMVATYRAGLTRLACSMLGDSDEAEDAVQQAFLAAALNLERYQPGTNFKAWLFTIAVNACRGELRKRKVRQALANLSGQSQLETEHGQHPEELALQNETARQLWMAVERLDDKHRLVVHLRFEQGMTIQGIAQVLSIPEKTVYTRLYNSFQQLRKQLVNAEEVGQIEEAVQKEVIL